MTVAARTKLTQIPVGLGEIKYTNNAQEVLVAYGLGSCVGIAIWDNSSGVAGLAHVILPTSVASSRPNDNPLKYADRAIPLMVNELRRLGGNPSRMVVKIAGGAQMLKSAGRSEVFNIGSRNVEQVRREIERAGLRISGEDVLGHQGRTMSLYPSDGRVTVQSAGNLRDL
ncbi:MAG: chemotaxis protein CheD [Thermomicrobiales bacterium]